MVTSACRLRTARGLWKRCRLGATKYEELFVLWTAIAARLEAAGLEAVMPEAGEFVTSLDMQACSLTLLWLDDELEPLWTAACDTPVLRRGATFTTVPATEALDDSDTLANFAKASDVSKIEGKCVAGVIEEIALTLKEAEEELGRIDAVAGDGDHGQGMRRGSAAALDAARAAVALGAGAASVLAAAGDAWVDRAGGTSGAIWGLLLRAWSNALSDTAAIEKHAVERRPSGARQRDPSWPRPPGRQDPR